MTISGKEKLLVVLNLLLKPEAKPGAYIGQVTELKVKDFRLFQ
jgi:hypothetical protein